MPPGYFGGIFMRSALLLVAITAMGFGGVSTAQAAIRLKPIKTCPYQADVAFKIGGARGEADGVASEYQGLALTHPGWSRDSQALLQGKNGRIYDLLFISKAR